jgi:zinc resistance-associated protein
MKKTSIIITALLMVALVAASAYAWGPGRGMGYGSNNQDCPRYGGQGNSAANLSDEQQEQLDTLRQQFIDETYEIRAANLQKRGEFKLLMQTSEPDREKLSALSQEITDLQKQLRDKGIEFALDAKTISPELGQGRGWGQGQGRGQGKGWSRGGYGCSNQGNSGRPCDQGNNQTPDENQ